MLSDLLALKKSPLRGRLQSYGRYGGRTPGVPVL